MGAAQNVFDAIEKGDFNQLKMLVGDDTSLAGTRNEAGVSALMTAAYHQRADMVELLRDTLPERGTFQTFGCLACRPRLKLKTASCKLRFQCHRASHLNTASYRRLSASFC